MRFLKNQPWNDELGYQEVADEVEWNLWSVRQPPYADLEAGDRVFLASNVGPAGSSVITWEVEILKVVTASYTSRRDAWDILDREFPSLRGTHRYSWPAFRSSDYTMQAPPAGWLLGWTYEPVRKVGVPRPRELRFRPNGWVSLDAYGDGQLRQWGLTTARTSAPRVAAGHAGQGRMQDAARRAAVELRAMQAARAWLRKEGWAASEIHDTSANKPFDLECRRGKRTLRVEVKGLTGRLGGVFLTRREVEHARTTVTDIALFVLTDVGTQTTAHGRLRGIGGVAHVWSPWEIEAGTLIASQFDYLPPAKEL